MTTLILVFLIPAAYSVGRFVQRNTDAKCVMDPLNQEGVKPHLRV